MLSSIRPATSIPKSAAHDPKLGHSRLVLAKALHGAKRVYNCARKLTGVWVFNRAIVLTQPHDFRLTQFSHSLLRQISILVRE
ncbi:hypothetical protein [Arthrobacter sp. KK5.5]|uniref:hypothetical protein n=1 Tax=Arthrobacter sp. KK5.5 TaxID=3373084 RepID=UPI003EE42D1D